MKKSCSASSHKRVLAVFLTALMTITEFSIMVVAAGTPPNAANPGRLRLKSTGIAPPHRVTDSAIVNMVDETNASDRCVLHIENASMVSPSELGVWVSVTYPATDHANVLRYITFTATINGKPVEKTFDVTPYTTPGVRWGKMSASSGENEMFDANGGLKPTVPLRINLATEGVPRFTDNVNFTLTGTAFTGDGENRSEPSSMPVSIPLPVVIIQGNPGPRTNPDILSAPVYSVSYKALTDFLHAGDGKFKYDSETDWGAYSSELQTRNYSTHRYVTLWDPHADPLNQPVIGYVDPQFYAADSIEDEGSMTMTRSDTITPLKADMFHIVRDYAESLSYASKVNLVGYSFGGLVVRWFALLDPQDVNTVITVASPNAGIAWFYEWVYNRMDAESVGQRIVLLSTKPHNNDFIISNRQEAEQMMAVPNTANPSTWCWMIPTYDCLIPPAYQPVDPYFHNPLNAPPASGVKYYNIYVDGPQSLKTDDQVHIKYVKDKNATGSFDWYKVTNVTQGNGDGVILAKSAASFGNQYPAQVTNQPIPIRCYHVFDLDNPVIQGTIYRDLREQ